MFGWLVRQRLALQVLIELNACFYLTPERAAKLALPQWHAAKQVDEVTLAWALLPWDSLVKVHRQTVVVLFATLLWGSVGLDWLYHHCWCAQLICMYREEADATTCCCSCFRS